MCCTVRYMYSTCICRYTWYKNRDRNRCLVLLLFPNYKCSETAEIAAVDNPLSPKSVILQLRWTSFSPEYLQETPTRRVLRDRWQSPAIRRILPRTPGTARRARQWARPRGYPADAPFSPRPRGTGASCVRSPLCGSREVVLQPRQRSQVSWAARWASRRRHAPHLPASCHCSKASSETKSQRSLMITRGYAAPVRDQLRVSS